MSESGLYPVQSWLWSELDDLGIDGVIYSRHILDLLISSKHTMDHRLAEKEQNIFSKIAPGSKRRKHKYSKRSSSFSACEEILWKKEIAVACLISAADAKTNSEDTVSTIQRMVDELYTKLACLQLTSDAKKACSDSDYYVADHNGNNLDVATDIVRVKAATGTRKKENYEDAFPSLDGNNASPVSANIPDSVWAKSYWKNESKSECDSDNKANNELSSALHNKEASPSADGSRTSATLPKSGGHTGNEGRFLQEERRDFARRPWKKSSTYPPYSRGSRKNHITKKQRSYVNHGSQNQDPERLQHKKIPRQRSAQAMKSEIRSKRNPASSSRIQGRNNNEKYTTNASKKPCKRDADGLKAPGNGKNKAYAQTDEDCTKEYAHLPSWMETTLTNVEAPCLWLNDTLNNTCRMYQLDSAEDNGEETRNFQQTAFSSKWYRDPETGLLTFQPSKSTTDRSTSSTGASSTGSEEEDDLLKEVMLGDGKQAAPESWMWCPSPSLWEEESQISPVSRLQSVYKRELLGSEQDRVNDISGRIWEEYKTIFLDLQDMRESSESEKGTNSDVDENHAEGAKLPSSNSWSADKTYDMQIIHDLDLEFDNQDVCKCDKPDQETDGLGSNGLSWSITDPENSATTSLPGVPCEIQAPLKHGVYMDADIWRYPVKSESWSAGDDTPHTKEDLRNTKDEVTRILEKGAFGFLCDEYAVKRREWHTASPKESAHEVWGGGDMPTFKKSEVAAGEKEEHVMNTLVDAMFSDLGFELLIGEGSHQDGNPGLDMLSQEFKGDWQNISDREPISPTGDGCHAVSFDVQSLFFQSPVDNIHFLHDDHWRAKLSMDDLFSCDNLTEFPSLANLDHLFVSLATAEQNGAFRGHHQLLQHGEFRKPVDQRKTFLESITENDAWKTSLRIGNIWQNISGIRPVDVIYSENEPDPRRDEKLKLSSETHFRPISATLGIEAAEVSYSDSDLLTSNDKSMYHASEQQAQNEKVVPEGNTKQELTEYIEEKDHLSFGNFSKLVQDKSMQTAFEMVVQHDMSDCQQLYSRPPKANSR